MNALDQEYSVIRSVMRGLDPITQEAYNLQAKIECAVENGDKKAENHFSSKLDDLIDSNPALHDQMRQLGKYLGVIS